MPLTFTLSNEQKVTGVTINPTTSTGKPSSIEPGSLETHIIDGNPNATGMVEADGSLSFISGDGDAALGATTFVVSGDADLGAGVETISDTVTINVTGANAKNLGLTGGTVVAK